ncbi:DoxX family protein [Solitalea canadensis]|nr:DoxX family protein [Solitalea canadensis]
MKKTLFSAKPLALDLALLLVRVGFGAAMITHGLQKLNGYSGMVNKFPSLFGIGSQTSLILAIFAELFCAALLILGLASRFALVFLIVTMGIAFFYIHGNDPFGDKEMAFLYLVAFIGLFFTGPGKYSVDSNMK